MIFSGLIHAIRTLTILPVPGSDDNNTKYYALPWFFVIGIAIGGFHYFTGLFFAMEYVPNIMLFAGLFLTIINYGISGALHLDGLADFADAFGTVYEKNKTLAILKDSHIGTFGVCSVVIAILWRTIAYHIILSNNALNWLIFGISISRLNQAILLGYLPYARGEDGKAYGYSATTIIKVILFFEYIVYLAVLCYYEGIQKIVIPVIFGSCALFFICRIFIRRAGGITGDCVGASSELFELIYFTAVIAFLD